MSLGHARPSANFYLRARAAFTELRKPHGRDSRCFDGFSAPLERRLMRLSDKITMGDIHVFILEITKIYVYHRCTYVAIFEQRFTLVLIKINFYRIPKNVLRELCKLIMAMKGMHPTREGFLMPVRF